MYPIINKRIIKYFSRKIKNITVDEISENKEKIAKYASIYDKIENEDLKSNLKTTLTDMSFNNMLKALQSSEKNNYSLRFNNKP